MLTIIIDTDFLLDCLRWRIDINKELTRILDEPFTMTILSNTINELTGKKDGKLAKAYAEKFCTIQETNNKEPFDYIIMDQPKTWVATQDKHLKEKLKKEGFGIITIRQQHYLMIQHVLRS